MTVSLDVQIGERENQIPVDIRQHEAGCCAADRIER